MEMQNYMEILMWQKLDDVLDAHPGICRCEKCRYDIGMANVSSEKENTLLTACLESKGYRYTTNRLN